ncbi:glycosyltransferase [Algoriphagus terrigena]|uniref:glycosyltransferase n=1 Tax=Algoriphagus terrigena TaxID=344884 RepID=UPI0004017264|nr:glycosyltransferase [Algoriphagus terrigena]
MPELSKDEISKREVEFSEAENPKVTFLVGCGTDLSNLVRLLESIKATSAGIAIEVILLVEEIETETARFIENNIRGLAACHTSESAGFLTTLNRAVANSRGEFFAVLKPSVLLRPNWLRELLNGISREPRIAMVDGKVLAKDGLLDEAGTFLDAAFQLQKYGESDFPDRPKYNFIREMEFNVGSNTLVRKEDFERAGGFEKGLSLADAFCTLSFTFREKLDKKIIYLPQAEAIRQAAEEGGKLDVSGFFVKSGGGSLERSFDDDRNARLLLNSRNVLFIDIGLPEHDRDSGSLRAFYLLKLLRELGNHVIVVPRRGQVASPYFEELIGLGVEVLYAFPDRKGMRRELTALLPSVAVAWICRPQLNREFEWIFRINPKIKWIFDTIDLHYMRLAREAEVFKSTRLVKKSARFKKLELSIASKADLTLTVTEDEKNLLEGQGIRQIAVIPNIHESHRLSDFPSFSQREGLLFIGSYHHPPNVDAVKWLVEEIMPIVWEKLRIPVTLLGNAPGKEVQALKNELVRVPGYVQDIAPFFTSHRVFVAPLRYGAGMKGKIGESLAYKLPIVTTAVGAEGVGLTHGVDVLIADDKESFAQQIIQAYQDEMLWSDLASNSEKVLNSYSPTQIREKLRIILEGLG